MKNGNGKKTLCAALLAGGILLLSGCGENVDKRDDPLAGYNADSLLPFDTRDPSLVTPTPEATNVARAVVTPTPAPTRVMATATAQAYVRIEPGDSGEGVRSLQARLIELGYLTGTPDGNYGTQTQNAVRLFQKALGISQTGVANVSLQERLYAMNAPAYTSSNTTAVPAGWGTVAVNNQNPTVATQAPTVSSAGYATLTQGDRGDKVETLQRRLQELGYLSGRADGEFGAMTAAAVKAFQAQLGLTQSGVASAALQERLFSAGAPYAPVSVTAAPRATSAPTARPTAVPTAVPTYNPYAGFTELKYGTKNSLAVQQMQNRLKALGYFSATATGNYYGETASAITAFQKAMGLTETGQATSETLYWLYSGSAIPFTPTSAPAAATPTPAPTVSGYATLKSGSRGDEVFSLQKRLIALGWMDSSADGLYGSQTVDAVKRFQAAVGYNQTGEATVELQTILFSSVAPAYVRPTATANVTVPPVVTAAPTATPTEAPSTYVTLQSGASGAQVEALQRRLKDLGYFSGQIGGNYLSKTTAAVQLFQGALGWPQDGVATAALQEVLYSSVAPAYGGTATGYTSLERGDSGAQVASMQARLIELGYLTGRADGSYGGNTEKAVSAFQRAAGLGESGAATVDTLARLYAADAPYAPAPTAEPTQAPIVTEAPAIVTQAPAPQTPAYTALKQGDSGEAVKDMQRRLQALGYFTGEIGGNYLTKTTAAVKAFQAALGWPQDGNASEELLAILYAANAPAYDAAQSGYLTLNKGSEGQQVASLQQRLIDLGWLGGAADGDYGGNTENAVLSFQIACGLPATGEADDATQRYLYSADAPIYVAPVATEVPYVAEVTAAPYTPEETVPPVTPADGGLKPGDTGEAVKDMQRRLQELGYFTGDIGGNYLEKTTAAVRAFQTALGWPEDGVATEALLSRLYAEDAPMGDEFKAIKEGDKGPLVLRLQKRLIELGYLEENKDTTDGEYGPMLSGAVMTLQAAMGRGPEMCTGEADSEFLSFIYSDAALVYAHY